jgi:hypothetical protein
VSPEIYLPVKKETIIASIDPVAGRRYALRTWDVKSFKSPRFLRVG